MRKRTASAAKKTGHVYDAFCIRCRSHLADSSNGVKCVHCVAVDSGTAVRCGYCARMRAPSGEKRDGFGDVCTGCAWHIDHYQIAA